jgi:Right handed beta helix region
VAYTLRGRVESRLAAALAPLVVACVLALALQVWWPVQLAGLMLAVGLVLDPVWYRIVPYQPGWAAVPLGLVELGAVMGLARVLEVKAPLAGGLGFFVGAWLLAQALGHAVFPLARLSYGEDGGELGRVGPGAVATALLVLAAAGGVAWATQPPVVHLSAGIHQGPLVLDSRVKLEGERGAVVRGGIHVTAGGVQIRDVAVVGGEVGILVEQAKNVLIERVAIRNATLDGIRATRSSVTVRDCTILSPPGAHGIELSFASAVGMNSVTGCTVDGGAEGIVSHLAMASFRDNTVRGTSLHGISITEMSMGEAVDNTVLDAKGVGLFCGDYSHCDFTRNTVSGTTAADEGRRSAAGYGIQSHFWAKATLDGNRLQGNAHRTGSFLHARLVQSD